MEKWWYVAEMVVRCGRDSRRRVHVLNTTRYAAVPMPAQLHAMIR